MDTNNKKLEAVLKYAQLGWALIPVGRGEDEKAPFLSMWAEYQKERPNEILLSGWWQVWPNADPAVITGEISGLVVLDIDIKDGNDRSPDEFDLPETVCSKTRSGGWHYFFKYPRCPVKNSVGTLLGPGIDIKAEGGYAILPPANNKAGSYQWINSPDDCEIAELPGWLLKKINESQYTDRPSQKENESTNLKFVSEIPIGMRNEHFTKIIGKLLSHFDPYDEDIKQLISMANNGNKDPLPQRELVNIYKSITKRELSKDGLTVDKKLKAVTAEELGKKEFPPTKWAVQDIFEFNSLNMLSAPSGSFKTWLTLHLAICLASGEPLFGKFKVAQQGVLFLNEEDDDRRFAERMNTIDPSGRWKSLRISFSYRGLNHFKFTKETVESVVSLAKEHNAGFLIFDAFKSTTLGDENSSSEMQIVMDCFKRLTDIGLTILITHHHRKGNGYDRQGGGEEIRGSTAIIAALDGHLICEPLKGEMAIAIEQVKSKGGGLVDKFIVKNNLGFGNFADTHFTYDGPYKKLGSPAQNKQKKKVLDILNNHNEWLSLSDLVLLGAGNIESLRDPLKEMVSVDKTIIVKDWVEVKRNDLPFISEGGAYNAKFYHPAEEGAKTKKAQAP